MRTFANIRTILHFTEAENNEAEVRKQANPFLPARNRWVFRSFCVSFSFKKVRSMFEKNLRFLSLQWGADLRRSRLVAFSNHLRK